MTKAEEFIREHTRDGSNKFGGGRNDCEYVSPYYYWLTPNQALRAVEIAKEELIEKAAEWLKENATFIHPRKKTQECIVNLSKFKEAMRKEE